MFMFTSIYHYLKVFGPLKGHMSKILGNLGHESSGASAMSFVCAECGGRGRCKDEENGVALI